MKLAETIIENERNKKSEENKHLVRLRLKELVYAYPKETLEVLHKTGVPISSILPSAVLYAVVVKHLAVNSELRESIAKMLFDLDGYSSADGKGWQLVGGALSAIGSVLSGVGRSQTEQATSESKQQAELMQQQLDLERQKRNRQMWIVIGVSSLILIAILIGVRAYMKSKALPATTPKIAVPSPTLQAV